MLLYPSCIGQTAFRVQQTALELVYVHKNAVGVGGWRIEERCSESYWFTERPARDPVAPTNAEENNALRT